MYVCLQILTKRIHLLLGSWKFRISMTIPWNILKPAKIITFACKKIVITSQAFKCLQQQEIIHTITILINSFFHQSHFSQERSKNGTTYQDLSSTTPTMRHSLTIIQTLAHFCNFCFLFLGTYQLCCLPKIKQIHDDYKLFSEFYEIKRNFLFKDYLFLLNTY